MSTVDKSRAAQKINYAIAGSAAVSLASLYFNATKIGRIANSALVLSIAARVLAGNIQSTQGEPALVTPSQPSLPVDVQGMLNKGISAVQAVNKAIKALHNAGRDWAIAELARRDREAARAALGNNTTPQSQGDAATPNQGGAAPKILMGIPVPQVKKKPTATKLKNTMLASLNQLVKGVMSPSVKTPTLGYLTKLTNEIAHSTTKPKKVLRERKKTVVQPTAPNTEEGENLSTTSTSSNDPEQIFSEANERKKWVLGSRFEPIKKQKRLQKLTAIKEEPDNGEALDDTTTSSPQPALPPANNKYRLIQALHYVAYLVGAKTTTATSLVPRTAEEEQQQIQKATQNSLEASPRVECNPYLLTTGTMNQSEIDGGNTACTAIAGKVLIAMLKGKLSTPHDIDDVLQAGVVAYKHVLSQLKGFKTDANQTQLLGWDQCYYQGFNTELQSPEDLNRRIQETPIVLSPHKNSYLEALQIVQQKAMDTKTRQGAILIVQPFTYAVSITPLMSGPVIQLFDSHGSLAYDALGSSNPKASIASFTSVEQLATYLNAKRSYDPQAQTPERNQFGLYMCQLRSEAQPTTTTTTFSGNDAELTPEEVSAQRLAKFTEKMNLWEHGLDTEIIALRDPATHSLQALDLFHEKLAKAKEKINLIPNVAANLPEHAQIINATETRLREKLGEFEQLLKQRLPAPPAQPAHQSQAVPAPTEAASPKPDSQAQVEQQAEQNTISEEDLDKHTTYLTEAQQKAGDSIHTLQTETLTADELEAYMELISERRAWMSPQHKLLSNAADPQGKIRQVLGLYEKHNQQLIQLEQLIAQKQAVQSATSLEALLTQNQSFITTCEKFLDSHKPNRLGLPLDTKFLREKVERNHQFVTELQKKAATFQQKPEQPDVKAQKFQQDLLSLQGRLTELQKRITEAASEDILPTKSSNQLTPAPTTYQARIETWATSITRIRAQLDISSYTNSSDFLADRLSDVQTLHDNAKQLYDSLTELHRHQKPFDQKVSQLPQQIQTIVTDAVALIAQIEQKQVLLAAPPSEPAETSKPPAPITTKSRWKLWG